MIDVTFLPIKTGGGILLNFADNADQITTAIGTLKIERKLASADDSTYVQLFSGLANDCLFFLDVNAGVATLGLPPGSYVYRMTDNVSTEVSDPVACASAILIVPNSGMSKFTRLIAAGVQNLLLPPSITNRPQVTTAMPLVGLPPLPIVVVNEDLYQQSEVPIGQQVEKPTSDNKDVTPTYMRAMWRMGLMTSNPAERNFWKDALVGISTSLLSSVFQYIGDNNTHDIQSASYQIQQDQANLTPGFYGADIMVTVEGQANLITQTFYGIIERIDYTEFFPDGVFQEAIVPNTAPQI